MGKPKMVARAETLEQAEPAAGWSEALFEKFFLGNYTRLVLFLFRLVGDRARAEELANDAFWRLYRQDFQDGRDHNLQGWLFRTATCLGIDLLRAEARRKRFESVGLQELVAHPAHSDPLAEVVKAEERSSVQATLARLKPASAQILLLRSSGLSYKEIAEALGVGVTSVGTLLARAEAEFEKCYRRSKGVRR